MDPSTPTPTPPSKEKLIEESLILQGYYKKLLKNKNFPLLGGIFLFLLIFIPIILLVLPKRDTNNKQQNKTTQITPVPKSTTSKKTGNTEKTPLISKTLLYGTWTSQSSILKTVDIDTSTVTTLATLPLTVKKISVLSNHTLLYIDEVDNNGYGQRVNVYDLQQQQIVTTIPADNGFGIADYVLSPNKRYLALWEIQLAQQTNTLQGGDSRVDIVDLTQPTIINQLFDETPISTTVPIHYPVAVLNNGTVFTDKMLLNETTSNNTNNVAYGMSIIDFDGTNEQDIPSMTNGTYGTVPTLSLDGKYLLFAGYNGSDGTTIKNGTRQALLTPNTIELLDTHTLNRYPLSNLPDTNIYSNAQWDIETGNPIITVLSPTNPQQKGIFSYDLTTLAPTQLPIPTVNETSFVYISQLNNTKTLVGTQGTGSSSIGNLGQTTMYGYNQLAVMDTSGKLSYLSLPDPLVQYITVLPGNYFNNVLGASTKRTITQSATNVSLLKVKIHARL